MILSELIKKGGPSRATTATPATIATQEVDEVATVAPVAIVAVAVKPELLPELTPDEETSIRAWLTYIEETDSAIITKVLIKSRDEPDARWYFLLRSEEVPETVTINERITCGECTFYERIDHPHLGHCTKGEPEAITGLWDTDHRYCKQYQSRQVTPADNKSTAKMVETTS